MLLAFECLLSYKQRHHKLPRNYLHSQSFCTLQRIRLLVVLHFLDDDSSILYIDYGTTSVYLIRCFLRGKRTHTHTTSISTIPYFFCCLNEPTACTSFRRLRLLIGRKCLFRVSRKRLCRQEVNRTKLQLATMTECSPVICAVHWISDRRYRTCGCKHV